MMACTEPSSIIRLTSLRARRPAKLLFTFLTCKTLMAGPFIRRCAADGSASGLCPPPTGRGTDEPAVQRSEEHTSELQSLMRISYAVFCLKQKTQQITIT